MPPGSQFARVAVDDDRWTAFRQAALARGLSISAYLGRLVEAEVKRREGLGVASVTADMPADEQALAALTAVRASISELDAIAGRLARSAITHGRSWDDVGNSLHLTAAESETAYAAEREP